MILRDSSILILIFFLNSISADDVTFLSLKQPKYDGNVHDTKVFCVHEMQKESLKLWSSGYLEISSNESCTIKEGSDPNVLKEDDNSYYLNLGRRFATRLNNWVMNISEDQKCYEVIYMPLFQNRCIAVTLETGAKMKASFIFHKVDPKNALVFFIGVLIFYLASDISKSELFQYFSGISIGVVGSVLILFIILARFIPKKSTAYLTMFFGSSALIITARWFLHQFVQMMEPYKLYMFIYILVCAFISWAYVYYHGPIKNQRAINLIEFALKLCGLTLMYFGSSFCEGFIAIITTYIVIKTINRFVPTRLVKNIWKKYFPEKRRLLSKEEYHKEATDYTLKALNELRDYCHSPQCNSWKVLRKLKKPDRFASFVDTGEYHVTEDELAEYDFYTMNDDLIDDDEDNLGNRNDSDYAY